MCRLAARILNCELLMMCLNLVVVATYLGRTPPPIQDSRSITTRGENGRLTAVAFRSGQTVFSP